MNGIPGFRVLQRIANPDPEARIEKLDRRLMEWSRAQESRYKLFAIQAHASIMKAICDDLARSGTGGSQNGTGNRRLLNELDVVFPGPGAKLVAILKDAGIRANVFTCEVPPAYERSHALELSIADQPPSYDAQLYPLGESAPASVFGFGSRRMGVAVPPEQAEIGDDLAPPVPPPDAIEWIRECLRRAEMPDPVAPANALEATLIETIDQICSEGNLRDKLRNLEDLATSLEQRVPAATADRHAVDLVAKVFAEVLAPSVRRLSPEDAPGKFELLHIVQMYCECRQRNDAQPVVHAAAQPEHEGVLPLALHLEIEFCLLEFATGKASTANKFLAARFEALIGKISCLREPRVQLDAFSRIYYGVLNPAQRNTRASTAFAGLLYKEHLMPAIRSVNADTRELQKVREPLLVNKWK